MMIKKVLIITYYWPPAGGISVQRVTKFCKYLKEFGWEPIVLTVKNGNFESIDNSLVNDVKHVENIYRAASIEPHQIYQFINKLKNQNKPEPSISETKSRRQTLLGKLPEYIRLNLFIPDSRIGWYYNAIREGKKIIRKHNPDLIFSTAPPYTPHLVAMSLHKKTGIPWVADFRDPWVENTLYNTVGRLKLVKNINRYLERKVVKNASALTFTGPKLLEHYSRDTGFNLSEKATVITNGYDAEDINKTGATETTKFFITYFGSLYPQRYLPDFFETLANLIKSTPELKKDLCLRFVGNINSGIKQNLQNLIPSENIEFTNFMPYKQAIKLLYAPQLLLLTIDNVPDNANITLGKVFDYLPSGNPVLGIGPPDGDTAQILRATGTGKVIISNDKHSIDNYITHKYREWKNNQIKLSTGNIKKFERKYLTERLADTFNRTIDNKQ